MFKGLGSSSRLSDVDIICLNESLLKWKLLVEVVGLLELRGHAQVGSCLPIPVSWVLINDQHLLLQVLTKNCIFTKIYVAYLWWILSEVMRETKVKRASSLDTRKSWVLMPVAIFIEAIVNAAWVLPEPGYKVNQIRCLSTMPVISIRESLEKLMYLTSSSFCTRLILLELVASYMKLSICPCILSNGFKLTLLPLPYFLGYIIFWNTLCFSCITSRPIPSPCINSSIFISLYTLSNT